MKAEKDTLMCADYNVLIGDDGICPACKMAHDMQSLYILVEGSEIPLPKRVLVVDDEPDVLGAVARYLESEGYEVHVERDGHGAFETYRECFPFDFVLSDFSFIPGQQKSSCGCVIRNGADLVREIRKLVPGQRMAIHSGNPKAAQDALDASVKDVPVLKKSFQELQKLLGKSQG